MVSWDRELVTRVRTYAALPIPHLLADLHGADRRKDSVNTRHDGCIGTLKGSNEAHLAGRGKGPRWYRGQSQREQCTNFGIGPWARRRARELRWRRRWGRRRVIAKSQTGPVKKDTKSGRERRDVVEKRDGNNQSKNINCSPAKNLPRSLAQLGTNPRKYTNGRPIPQPRTVRCPLVRSRAVDGVEQSKNENGNTKKEVYMQEFWRTVTPR